MNEDNEQRKYLLSKWRKGEERSEVLREMFPDRLERYYVMEMIRAVAKDHQGAAKIMRWIWIVIGAVLGAIITLLGRAL